MKQIRQSTGRISVLHHEQQMYHFTPSASMKFMTFIIETDVLRMLLGHCDMLALNVIAK